MLDLCVIGMNFAGCCHEVLVRNMSSARSDKSSRRKKMNASSRPETLHRGLKNRHIQLIALGGAIGTGLFLGIAETISMAGPSVILGYGLGGIIAFFIMRQLGEMVVEEPVAGTFSFFANKYWGDFAGFMSGWNYWVLYVLVGMAELTAVGLYVQYWWPTMPTWGSAAIFFVQRQDLRRNGVLVCPDQGCRHCLHDCLRCLYPDHR
jgi:amino acid permease